MTHCISLETSLLQLLSDLCPTPVQLTGGLTKFSTEENFRKKILKVSHFSLGFSLDEKFDKIRISRGVSLMFSRSGCKIFNKGQWDCMISLLLLPGESHKWKWLTCKILLRFFLAENLSMHPVTLVSDNHPEIIGHTYISYEWVQHISWSQVISVALFWLSVNFVSIWTLNSELWASSSPPLNSLVTVEQCSTM